MMAEEQKQHTWKQLDVCHTYTHICQKQTDRGRCVDGEPSNARANKAKRKEEEEEEE